MGTIRTSARTRYAGYRFPAEILGHAVCLYFRFPLGLRMVEELLAARGIIVSHETVRQSARKFGQQFANQIRRRLPRVGRSVADVTRDLLLAVADLAGDVVINLTPQEVPWTVPFDQDHEHARYDPAQVGAYFAGATQAALVLADFRAPYRGRSTPVNAWWGSFDLAVNLFSGMPADPPSDDFIMRNAMDAQEVAIGWWPGDPRYGKAAFYAYAHPAPEGFPHADLSPGRWDGELGEYVLDWDDVRSSSDPHAVALEFAHSAFRHACAVCEWDPALAATAEGTPPPVR